MSESYMVGHALRGYLDIVWERDSNSVELKKLELWKSIVLYLKNDQSQRILFGSCFQRTIEPNYLRRYCRCDKVRQFAEVQ